VINRLGGGERLLGGTRLNLAGEASLGPSEPRQVFAWNRLYRVAIAGL
jgi:hypothetical protein